MANILIVEDDKVLNDAYCLILKKAGHKILSAQDGQEALDITGTVEPDIIFLDLLMPRVDGLKFLETYDLTQHPKVKVVILSNIGNDKEVEKAMSLGAYKYIVKAHASPEDLSTLVQHLVNKDLGREKEKVGAYRLKMRPWS